MNLPNKLTVLRIILTFVFMFFLFMEGLLSKVLALIVFSIASITDFCDGYFARKHNLVTDLGKLLDPLADKILVLAAFLAFVEKGIIPAWMVVIIILRESLLTGLRILAANKGKILAAAKAGRHKTISQMVSIFIILGFIVFKEVGIVFFSFWNSELEFWLRNCIYVLMLITVAFTLISGIFYLKENKNIFRSAKTD